jgi:hypothetical protein
MNCFFIIPEFKGKQKNKKTILFLEKEAVILFPDNRNA